MNALPIVLTLAGIILLAYLLYRAHMKRERTRAALRLAAIEEQTEIEKAARLDRILTTVNRNKVRQKIAATPADPEYARKARERLERSIPPLPRPTGHSSTNLAFTDRQPAPINNPPPDYLYVDHSGLSPTFLAGMTRAPSISTFDSADRCASNSDSGYNHTSDSSSSDSGSSACSSD